MASLRSIATIQTKKDGLAQQLSKKELTYTLVPGETKKIIVK